MKKCNSVILIDDDPLENLINRKLIEKLDFTQKIEVFSNGFEGINFLKILLQVDNPPDVIFVDINMPIMNGFEFLKEFHLLPKEFKQKIKVIVLTSSLSENDHKTAQLIGCDGYLTKPLTKEKIREEYEKIFTK
ncbi:MAG TPA: response regulator [Cytophagales bacterium]|nr:response regulator [Cytophagales bacterium]